MSTSRWTKAPSRLTARFGAAVVLLVTAVAATTVISTTAQAGGVRDTSCLGTWRDFNCVTQFGPLRDPYVRPVPQASGKAEQARLAARERRWLTHCRPIIFHDAYGVARYRYAAPGCEFGVGED